MKKVAAIVQNSVMHDARVLKEAATLQKAGYQVVVFGIKDANNVFDEKILYNGVSVRLVAWRSAMHRALQKITVVMLVLALPLLAVSVWILAGGLFSLLPDSFDLNLQTLAKTMVQVGLTGMSLLLGTYVLYRFYRRQRAFAANYAGLESGMGSAPLQKSIAGRIIDNFLYVRQRALADAVMSFRPDIVHCHDVHTIRVGALLKRRTGAKIVYDAHEIYEEVAQGSDAQRRENRKGQKVAERIADGFITINDSIAQYYRDEYPRLPAATVVMNASVYEPDLAEYDGRLHKAAGLPSEQRILLYQGGFAQKRGLFELLDVAMHLPLDWTLVFMGWGNIQDELVARASNVNTLYRANFVDEQVREIEARLVDDMVATRVAALSSTVSTFSKKSESFGGGVLQSRSDDGAGGLSDFEGRLDHLEEQIRILGERLAQSSVAFDTDAPVPEQKELLSLKRLLHDQYGFRHSPRICFVDRAPQRELVRWTMGATIGVIPYEYVGLNHYYCTPNKLWEYSAAGVPMLVSPFPEMRKIVGGNELGWFLEDPIEPRKVAEFISSLDEVEVQQKRSNCFRHISQDNWSKYESSLVELYATISEGGGR